MQCQKCKVEMEKGVFENSSWAQLSDELDKSAYMRLRYGTTFLGKLGLFKNWFIATKFKTLKFVYAYRCPKCKEVVFYSED